MGQAYGMNDATKRAVMGNFWALDMLMVIVPKMPHFLKKETVYGMTKNLPNMLIRVCQHLLMFCLIPFLGSKKDKV